MSCSKNGHEYGSDNSICASKNDVSPSESCSDIRNSSTESFDNDIFFVLIEMNTIHPENLMLADAIVISAMQKLSITIRLILIDVNTENTASADILMRIALIIPIQRVLLTGILMMAKKL
jgi:sulfate adenylyltransferase subunit 1 (EFTu-like GTPase family)